MGDVPRAEIDGELLSGGVVNTVIRRGDRIYRSAGPWTPTVQRFLRHLRARGFDYAPEVIGMDDADTEILANIDGTSSLRPWPGVLRTDDGLRQIGRMLADLQTAAASFPALDDDQWRTSAVPVETALIKAGEPLAPRHGDIGPWNMIWQGDRLVGLIDWDMAEPAPPWWDIGQAAWYCVPLIAGERHRINCGFTSTPDLGHRFAVLCEAFGLAAPGDVYDALLAVMDRERHVLQTLGAAGVAPFRDFLARGDLEQLDDDQQRLHRWRSAILAGLDPLDPPIGG